MKENEFNPNNIIDNRIIVNKYPEFIPDQFLEAAMLSRRTILIEKELKIEVACGSGFNTLIMCNTTNKELIEFLDYWLSSAIKMGRQDNRDLYMLIRISTVDEIFIMIPISSGYNISETYILTFELIKIDDDMLRFKNNKVLKSEIIIKEPFKSRIIMNKIPDFIYDVDCIPDEEEIFLLIAKDLKINAIHDNIMSCWTNDKMLQDFILSWQTYIKDFNGYDNCIFHMVINISTINGLFIIHPIDKGSIFGNIYFKLIDITYCKMSDIYPDKDVKKIIEGEI